MTVQLAESGNIARSIAVELSRILPQPLHKLSRFGSFLLHATDSFRFRGGQWARLVASRPAIWFRPLNAGGDWPRPFGIRNSAFELQTIESAKRVEGSDVTAAAADTATMASRLTNGQYCQI